MIKKKKKMDRLMLSNNIYNIYNMYNNTTINGRGI
jgi:hypothetical protein